MVVDGLTVVAGRGGELVADGGRGRVAGGTVRPGWNVTGGAPPGLSAPPSSSGGALETGGLVPVGAGPVVREPGGTARRESSSGDAVYNGCTGFPASAPRM